MLFSSSYFSNYYCITTLNYLEEIEVRGPMHLGFSLIFNVFTRCQDTGPIFPLSVISLMSFVSLCCPAFAFWGSLATFPCVQHPQRFTVYSAQCWELLIIVHPVPEIQFVLPTGCICKICPDLASLDCYFWALLVTGMSSLGTLHVRHSTVSICSGRRDVMQVKISCLSYKERRPDNWWLWLSGSEALPSIKGCQRWIYPLSLRFCPRSCMASHRCVWKWHRFALNNSRCYFWPSAWSNTVNAELQ